MLSGIVVGLLTGAIVGWLASLVLRAQTQGLVWLYFGLGAGAGSVAAAAMGADFPIDGFAAGLLASTASMVAAALISWRLNRAPRS